MLLGYNTNGLAHHSLSDALSLLHRFGYESVAITIDHHALSPFHTNAKEEQKIIRAQLESLGLRNVLETGARYLLDPHTKHEPTLVSPSPEARTKRIKFLKDAIDLASDLQSDCVSLWAGVVRDGANETDTWNRLIPSIRDIMDYASARSVVLGFEPEPGMFIDTMTRHEELLDRLGIRKDQNDSPLQLTLDIGHLHCQGETPISDYIRDWGNHLVNVHLEDMRRGKHEHLPFGEGEIDFPPILQALKEVDYQNGVHVELSRHSHVGPQMVEDSANFLRPLFLE